jgi:hypothetical protein
MSPDTATLNASRPGVNGASGPPLPPGPFRPRPGVLAARALDAMALYDPREERYLTLNPVATRIWELLSDGNLPVAIVESLSSEYDVPRDQVATDVTAQIASFLRDQLIELGTIDHRTCAEPGAPAQSSGIGGNTAHSVAAVKAKVAMPSVLRCGVTIAWIKHLLRTRRFEGAIAWIRARVEHIPATAAAELEQVRELEYAVAMAGAFYPGRARCMEQSLALYLVARWQGVAVRYCQGVQLYPFQAHAWIEYQGQVINDVPEHVKHFARFPEQLP